MQKLHLVGFTTDQDGLILSARKGARSGGYTLVLDDALARAVEELRVRRDVADEERAGARGSRVESRLPISEIQARLRRGRSVKDVAKDAGVDPEWVERFATPVFAEQAQVISRVRNTALRRQRLGPSGLRIGDAVRRNLVERGVVMSPAEYDEAWTTHQRADGRWIVKFSFHYRGSNKTLRFDVVEPNGEPVAADALTNQLAYVTPPPKKAAPRPKPVQADPDEEPPTAKRAVVSVGFRPETPTKAVSRPAKEREKAAKEMSKAAARRAVEGERAAARKARERTRMLAQREREARADQQRRDREQAARVREAAVAARIAAAEQAEREAAAAKAAAARQVEREAARKAARQKAASAPKRGGTARKATPTRPATKASSKAAPASKARPAKKAPSPRPAPSPAKAAAPRPAASKASEPAKARRPSAPPRPEARVDAVPPPASRRRPESPAAERPARPGPTRPAVESPARPAPAAPAGPGLSGAAVDVYGPEATRALFRAGLVEQARDGDRAAAPPRERATPAEPAATENGSAAAPRTRPPGLRRRRQLRAN